MLRREVVAVCFCLPILGCATRFGETHYFRATTHSSETNYYRLTVRGCTLLANARFVSGYFDEAAVEAYFSEFAQPAQGKFQDMVNRDTGTQPLDSKLKGRALVLLLSSNSDDIANQIGALAENQDAARALGRLLNRDKFSAAADAVARRTLQRTRDKVLAAQGKDIIGNLPDTADRAETEAALLQYANAIAATLGSDRAFGSLEEAARWLEYNRSRIQKDKP